MYRKKAVYKLCLLVDVYVQVSTEEAEEGGTSDLFFENKYADMMEEEREEEEEEEDEGVEAGAGEEGGKEEVLTRTILAYAAEWVMIHAHDQIDAHHKGGMYMYMYMQV